MISFNNYEFDLAVPVGDIVSSTSAVSMDLSIISVSPRRS